MSNISRRKFLKGAGVAVLAVAASGMLTACGSEEKVPMKEVVVIFKNKANSKEEVAPRGTVKVPAADGTVDPSKVTAPDNYVVVSNEPVKIQKHTPEEGKPDDKAYEYIEVTVAFGEGTRTVKVNFVCDSKTVKTVPVDAKFNASVVAASAFESEVPAKYEIIDAQDEYAITDGEVNVLVQVKTVEVEYCFNYPTKVTIIGGTTITIKTDKVMSFKRSMLATVEGVPSTDSNIPTVAFTGKDGNPYKVVEPRPAAYPVKNGKIEIEVEKV